MAGLFDIAVPSRVDSDLAGLYAQAGIPDGLIDFCRQNLFIGTVNDFANTFPSRESVWSKCIDTIPELAGQEPDKIHKRQALGGRLYQVWRDCEAAVKATKLGADSAAEAVADVQAKAEEIKQQQQAQEKAADDKEQFDKALAETKEGAAGSATAVPSVTKAAAEAKEGFGSTMSVPSIMKAAAEAKRFDSGKAETPGMVVEFDSGEAETHGMVVEFDSGKGFAKSVIFKHRPLGFSCARTMGGFGCMSAPRNHAVVCKVEKKQQAALLGVKKGWVVKAVDGMDVAGPEEANRLLEEGASLLCEVDQDLRQSAARAAAVAVLAGLGSLATSAM